MRFSFKGAWELYNLAADRTEQCNLAATEPALAAELAALWEAWAKRANVLPVQEFAQTSHGPAGAAAAEGADPAATKAKKKKAAEKKMCARKVGGMRPAGCLLDVA